MAIAKLLSADKRATHSKLIIEFTDGETVNVEACHFSGAPQDLKAFLRAKDAKRDDIKSYDFSSYVGTIIDLSIPTPPDPTAEEIAKVAWFKDLVKLERFLRLEKTGVIQIDDVLITALQTSLTTDWIASYFGDL